MVEGIAIQRAIRSMVHSVRRHPRELAVRDIAALHRTGLDLVIDTTERNVVVFVEPRCGVAVESLTPRQREVAGLVVTGLSNQQIARTLSISLATVKDHVHAILEATGMDSRARLIANWYGGGDRRLR